MKGKNLKTKLRTLIISSNEGGSTSVCGKLMKVIYSNLPNITLVATKVHVILIRFVVVTWICDNKGSVLHVTLRNNTMSTLQ